MSETSTSVIERPPLKTPRRSMQLGRVSIHGYRSIRDSGLEPTSLNVLLGANGAGKSNLLGFFKFANKLMNGELQIHVGRKGGADHILHFGSKTTSRLQFEIDISNWSYSVSLVPTADDRLVFERERWWYRPTNVSFTSGIGTTETSISHVGEADWDAVVEQMQQWRVYHFNDTTEQARLKRASPLGDSFPLREDGGNIAPFLKLQEHLGTLGDIASAVRRVAPFFGRFILEPDPLRPDTMRLRWRHVGTDDYFDANDLSDGTLRFICLAALLLQAKPPATLFVDEPELGLHPHALHLLAALLRVAATRTQVIVSTQSVTLVNQLALDSIIVVDRIENASVFRRVEAESLRDWIDDYAAGELWEKNLIGGNP